VTGAGSNAVLEGLEGRDRICSCGRCSVRCFVVFRCHVLSHVVRFVQIHVVSHVVKGL